MRKRIIFLLRNKKYKISGLGIFFLLLSSFIFSCLLGELLMRKFVFFPLQKEYLRFACLGYRIIPNGYKDIDLFWTLEKEFREVSYLEDKKPGVVRVVCIGDSITQGYYSLFREETYPYKLEEMLNKKFPGKFELLNAGYGGFSSFQGSHYLEKKICKYKPDLVICWFGVNDNSPAFFYQDKEQRVLLTHNLQEKGILSYSKLYIFLKNYFAIKRVLKARIPRVTPEDYYANCEQMYRLSKEKNFDIVFVIPFQLNQAHTALEYLSPYVMALEALEEKYNCCILDLVKDLEGYNIRDIFIDRCHPNAKGNSIVAQIIFRFLEDKWSKDIKT